MNTDLETELRRQLKERDALHQIATRSVQSSSEDELIELATRLIGNTLQADNYGFLLINENNQLRTHPSYQAEKIVYPTIPVGEGITGRVAKSGTPIHVEDVARHPDYLPAFQKTRAEICVPLVVDQRVIGVINAESNTPDAFSSSDESFLVTIANQMAISIERFRSEAVQKHREYMLSTIYEIAHRAVENLGLNDLMFEVTQRIVDRMNFYNAEIALIEDNKLVFKAGYGGYSNGIFQPGFRVDIGKGITGKAAAKGESLLVSDVSQTPDFLQNEYLPQTQSELAIPLIAKGQVIGVLDVSRSQPNAITTEDAALMKILADQVATAVFNAWLFTSEARRRQEAETLYKASSALTTELELEQVLDQILVHLEEVVPYDNATVLLLERDFVRIMTTRGSDPSQKMIGLTFPSDNPIIAEIQHSKKPIYIEDITQDPSLKSWVDTEGIRGWMGVPLILGGKVIGGLTLESRQKAVYEEIEAYLVQAFANQAAVAIQNAQLYEASRKKTQELSELYDTAIAISSALEIDTFLEKLGAQIQRRLAPDSLGVFLYQESTQEFEVLLALENGEPIKKTKGLRLPLEEGGLTGWVMQNRTPFLVGDVLSDPLPVQPKHVTKPSRSWLGVPLLVRDRLIGAISVQTFRPLSFNRSNQRFLESLASQIAITIDNARLYEELEESYVDTVFALARAMDTRDTYTNDHSQRLASWAIAIAQKLDCTPQEIQVIEWAALLHDIGKIGVPDEILLKPDKLTQEEWLIMQKHPEVGAEIVTPIKKLADVVPLIRTHQEKYDGTGYPEGLRGEEIPLGSRILAVVDAYSAMTDDRVYRSGISHEEAVEELRNCAGGHFDPRVVDIFLEVLEETNGKV